MSPLIFQVFTSILFLSFATAVPVSESSGIAEAPQNLPTSISTGSLPPRPSPNGTISAGVPGPTGTEAPPTVQSAISPSYYYCSREQKRLIQEAWNEATQLAEAHTEWKTPGWFSSGAYQPAMNMYMGTDSAKDTPWFGTGALRQNIDRQLAIHKGDASTFTYAYFYCDEKKLPGRSERSRTSCGDRTTAFTFADPGWIWSNHYVNFCPLFFSDKMTSLAAKVEEAKKDKTRLTVINEWRAARARSMFHETYHWGDTVSRPAAVPKRNTAYDREIYQPRDVVNLAKTKNIEISRLNAESWAQAATAIFIQKTFGVKDPPAPGSYPKAVEADLLEEKFLEEPPEDFVSPPQPARLGDPVDLPGLS